MSNYLDKKECRDIWDDAMKFREDSMENTGKQETKETKENDIYYKILKCKVCKEEIKMSCKYNGNYPLCYKHRNPNERK